MMPATSYSSNVRSVLRSIMDAAPLSAGILMIFQRKNEKS